MRLRSILVLLLSLATALSVFGYNLWLYRCGACTLRALITPSVTGYFLALLNGALLLVWLGLKRRNERQASRNDCSCGRRLLPVWHFCPACGRRRSA
jgi:hypothetical protein